MTQDSLCYSKEHCRILSQKVHEREVYFQPGRLGHIDALTIHGHVEKCAKFKNSFRQQQQQQQQTGNPKMMFL